MRQPFLRYDRSAAALRVLSTRRCVNCVGALGTSLTWAYNPWALAACVKEASHTLLVAVGKSPHPLLAASCCAFAFQSSRAYNPWALAACVNEAFQMLLVGVGNNPHPLSVASCCAVASQTVKLVPNPLSTASFCSSSSVVGSFPHPLSSATFWVAASQLGP